MNAPSVREVVQRLCPVGAVDDYRIETGRDSTGDPAVWVFVVVDEARINEIWPVWDQLRQDIRDAVATIAGPEVMVYVRMTSRGESDESTRLTA